MEMHLEAERWLIRPFVAEDADQLYELLSDPAVMAFLEPVYSMERTTAFLQEAGLCQPPLVYALVWKENGELIGQVIYHSYEGNSREIGWLLRPAYWGRGIASEITLLLAAHAQQEGADSCVLECDPRQVATGRIAQKCGFLPQGEQDGLCLYRKTFPK